MAREDLEYRVVINDAGAIKSIDKIDKKLDKNSKNIVSGNKKQESSLKSLGTAWKILAGSIIAKVVIGAFKKITTAAMNAQEKISKFNTVFASVRDAADITAKNLAGNFGLSSVKAKQLLSDTGDLLTGFGFTGEAALDLSTKVNELAVDLASFTNYSGGAEGASQALTKALLGERESVKSLGIAILEEDVKAKIKSMEVTGELTNETDRQKKAYATLAIAMEQSKNAIGDFQRTSGSSANQLRILKSRFEDLQVASGDYFNDLLTKALPTLIKIVEKLTIIVGKIREWQDRTSEVNKVISFLRDNIKRTNIETKAYNETIKNTSLNKKQLEDRLVNINKKLEANNNKLTTLRDGYFSLEAAEKITSQNTFARYLKKIEQLKGEAKAINELLLVKIEAEKKAAESHILNGEQIKEFDQLTKEEQFLTEDEILEYKIQKLQEYLNNYKLSDEQRRLAIDAMSEYEKLKSDETTQKKLEDEKKIEEYKKKAYANAKETVNNFFELQRQLITDNVTDEKDRAKKLDKINKAYFNLQKGTAAIEVAISTARAIMKAFEMFGPPPSPVGIVAAALAGVSGGIQEALILSKKYPEMQALRGGGLVKVGEGGTEAVSLPIGSRVYNHSETGMLMRRGAAMQSATTNNITNDQGMTYNIYGPVTIGANGEFDTEANRRLKLGGDYT